MSRTERLERRAERLERKLKEHEEFLQIAEGTTTAQKELETEVTTTMTTEELEKLKEEERLKEEETEAEETKECIACEDQAQNIEKNTSLHQKLGQYHNTINELELQLGFHRRGENREGRRLVKECKELLKKLEKVITKNNKYNRKIENGSFEIDVRSQEEISTMFNKLDTNILTIKNQLGQLITGDSPGTKKFISPDVLENPLSGAKIIPNTPAGKERHNACANGTGGKSGISKRGEIVDNDIAPWLDKNITNGQGTRMISSGLKLGMLVANGVMARNIAKSVRSLRGADSEGSKKAWGKILVNAGGIAALNFVDPEKAMSHLKDARGFVTGNSSGTGSGRGKGGSIDTKASVDAIKDAKTTQEQKEEIHGPMVVGAALAGLTHSEVAAIPGIFECVGDKITGVDCAKLLNHYKNKFGNNTKAITEFTTYVKSLEEVQKLNPKLIATVMDKKGITVSDFSNPALANTIIGSRLVRDLAVAKEVSTGVLRIQLENKINTANPEVSKVLGAQYTKLIDGIVGMQSQQQQDILDGNIVFGIESGKLFMSSSKEKVTIDLTAMSISTVGADGDSLCPLRFINETDLLYGAYHTAQIINKHRTQYMIDEPFFYQKGRGGRGHDMRHSTGGRSLANPFSWTQGTSQETLGGSWFEGLDKTSPIIYKNFEQYVNYMNDLHIRKNADADHYIAETLKPQFMSRYPNTYNDPNYDKMIDEMIKTHFGLYTIRQSREDLLLSSFRSSSQALINGIKDKYDKLYQFTTNKYNDLKTRIGAKAQLVYEAGERFWTHPDSPKVKLTDWVKDKRDQKDTIRKDIVTQAGLDRDKLKDVTFDTLPKGIGELLIKIIKGIGIFIINIAKGGIDAAKSSL